MHHFFQKIIYIIEIITHVFGYKGHRKHCICCGFTGFFEAYGHPPRYEALCPSCGSLERHRLLILFFQTEDLVSGNDILHFAPEPFLSPIISQTAKLYKTADYTRAADLKLDIETIDQPDESWDIILCCHVLEHVDDKLALSELKRILRKNGKLILMVPIIEGWDTTYENSLVTSENERELHYGQHDHIRYYGRDFRNRLQNAGFELIEYTATGEDCARFGLIKGDKVFICTPQ